MKCWKDKHLFWISAIGVPIIVVWVIGTPLIGFLYLLRKRKVLDQQILLSRYRMIYQGLKTNLFYWEFVNILRKTFLVAVNAFLSMYPDIFKALLSLLFLSVFMRIQKKLEPYKNPVINALESREILTTIITFYGALYFVSEEISDVI